tara:strand:- start:689 stop:1495 length:807 start_codon:yes stop_codon:yes gene_type:complete
MATIDLGRLGFVNKGTYNNSTTYEKNDLVQFTDGGILSTYLYIDSTAQSGQAPSSSGTAGSRWTYFAKGVADSLASAGNNKVIVTNASGQVTPLAIGSASQVLKVNSGANGFEFGADAGGKIGQVIQTSTNTAISGTTEQDIMTVAITPSATSSKILIQTVMGIGTANWNGGLSMERRVSGGSTEAATYSDGVNYSGATNAFWSTDNFQSSDEYSIMPYAWQFLDSPNTTSAITYAIRTKSMTEFYFNRTDQANAGGCMSTMIAWEIL